MSEFDPIEVIDKNAMRISNCLYDPEEIISDSDTQIWQEDFRQNGSRLGHSFFINESQDKYNIIHQAMMRAAETFLMSTHRDISDYEPRYNFYKIFKWETPMDAMSEHADRWSDGDNLVIPDISLVMYFTDDFEGGNLVFEAKVIRPHAGDIIVFNSDLLHGVTPVLGGRRITTQLFLFKK